MSMRLLRVSSMTLAAFAVSALPCPAPRRPRPRSPSARWSAATACTSRATSPMDRGHLQGGRARRALHLAHRQGAGHGGTDRQYRFRADPVRRRAGRAERRRDPLRRRQVDVKSQWVFVDARRHHQARGPQGQDHRLWPAGSADYDEGATVSGALLQYAGRQGLQGDRVPGRARAHRRRCSTSDIDADAGVGGACRAGGQHGDEGDRAHLRQDAARRRHVLVAARPYRARIRRR